MRTLTSAVIFLMISGCGGGQYVIVIPEKNLVVTFTSNNYASENAISLPLNLLVEHIIPALDS